MCSIDMPRSPAFYLPILCFFWVIFTLILTLSMAIYNEHLPKNTVPFISMLGDRPPERCFFSICTCIAAFLSSILVYSRYRQIDELIDDANLFRNVNGNILPRWFGRMNCVILTFGFLMGLGLAMLGCFQMTDAEVAHFLGAGCFVICGLICILLHTILCCSLSYHEVDPEVDYVVCVIRGIITTICGGTYLVFLYRLWRDDIDDFYTPHTIARTTCQWIGTILLASYFLTYVHEFKRLKVFCRFHTEQRYGDNYV